MSIAEKLSIVANNTKKVYDAGYESGKEHGLELGGGADFKGFWEKYMQKGGIYGAAYMFAFGGWNDATFTPTYSLKYLTNAGNMFNTCGVTDLKGILERQGVVFDFSKVTNFVQAFSYSKLTHLPTIDTSSANALSTTFGYSSSLISIPLILKDDGTQTFPNTFIKCTSLTNLTIEGVIGNDIDLKWSPLSRASIKVLITHLSQTTTGKTVTLNEDAVNNAFATSEGANDGSTSSMWESLVASRSNWTISLINPS